MDASLYDNQQIRAPLRQLMRSIQLMESADEALLRCSPEQRNDLLEVLQKATLQLIELWHRLAAQGQPQSSSEILANFGYSLNALVTVSNSLLKIAA